MWRDGGDAGSQPMRTAMHITWHGAQINFGELPPYLTYGSARNIKESLVCEDSLCSGYTATHIDVLYIVRSHSFLHHIPQNHPASISWHVHIAGDLSSTNIPRLHLFHSPEYIPNWSRIRSTKRSYLFRKVKKPAGKKNSQTKFEALRNVSWGKKKPRKHHGDLI